MRGFSALAMAASREGALDKKTKELIAMALVKPGTTRAGFEAMLGLCIYMGGGPSLQVLVRDDSAQYAAEGSRRRKPDPPAALED